MTSCTCWWKVHTDESYMQTDISKHSCRYEETHQHRQSWSGCLASLFQWHPHHQQSHQTLQELNCNTHLPATSHPHFPLTILHVKMHTHFPRQAIQAQRDCCIPHQKLCTRDISPTASKVSARQSILQRACVNRKTLQPNKLQLQQNKAAKGEAEHCTTHEQAMHLDWAYGQHLEAKAEDRRLRAEGTGRRQRQKA